MSNALAVVPRTLDEVNSLSELLAKSTLLPEGLRGKTADIAVSILAGQELGLSPMAAIRGVFVVQGKPVLAADTMVGLVLASGAAEYFQCVEDTDARVTYETKRKGAPSPQRVSWTTEDTKRAGLNTKDNWRLFTRSMMKARAKAILARDAFPDVLAGVYAPEETDGMPAFDQQRPIERQPIDVIDAEVVSETPPPELAEIETVTSRDALKQLAPKLAELPEHWKRQASDRYKARLKELAA